VRRARRAVRQAGTVGVDDANLVSVLPAVLPAVEPAPPEAPNEAARSAGPTGSLDRSADDTDIGWGEREPGSNDDRLTGDKPPHW